MTPNSAIFFFLSHYLMSLPSLVDLSQNNYPRHITNKELQAEIARGTR